MTDQAVPFYHAPIMAGEVLSLLEPSRGGIFVDGTLGGGECTFPRGAVGFRAQRVKCRKALFDVARPDVDPGKPTRHGFGAG